MPLRRTILISALTAAFATGFALAVAQDRGDDGGPRGQQPPATKAQPRPDPARMQALLRLWEGQSAKLKSLDVSLYRVDRDLAWGDEEHYLGHAAFQNPSLAYIDYRKVKMQAQSDPNVKGKKVFVPTKKKNGEVDSVPFETILCTGTEVWDYRYDVRQIIVYTLDKDERKRALEEGPLPFLFNLKAGDAEARYNMELRSEDQRGYLVMVKPKVKEDAAVFRTAFIWLDREFLLPTRIRLIAPDNKSWQDFTLSKINPNKVIPARFFQGVNPGKGWKLERNPGSRPPSPPTGSRSALKRTPPKTAATAPPGSAGFPPPQTSNARDDQRDDR
jgi:TIGR03009 family protein